jgi:hypothetical protein
MEIPNQFLQRVVIRTQRAKERIPLGVAKVSIPRKHANDMFPTRRPSANQTVK